MYMQPQLFKPTSVTDYDFLDPLTRSETYNSPMMMIKKPKYVV